MGQSARSVFGDREGVAQDLAAVDWAATPLGPPEGWPQSLVSVVRLMMSSRFPMWMAWGPELTLLCNDAYRPILGSKYASSLGRPTAEVWAEIWQDIAPRIERVIVAGETTWDEALLLFLERNGYREETYFTFSYSPLADDDDRVVGLFCVVNEDTERVVGARHLATLRDVGASVTALGSQSEVLEAATVPLAADPLSLPFVLVYLLDGDGGTARLATSTGVPPGHPLAAPALDLTGADSPWPLEEVLHGRSCLVDDLVDRFSDLPTGGWDARPTRAVLLPFSQRDGGPPSGFAVAALNPHRPYDEDYRGFTDVLAGQLGDALASARAHQDERDRVARLQELDRAKTDFFTNVSHEFRTPLTLLLGPAEDALADTARPLDPVQRERFEVVHRNAERLLKLVNTLLDFSRLEQGTLDAQFEPVDLAAHTAELVGAFSAAVERVGLRLVVDCPPLPEPVWVDREAWAKIVLNLLSNALKFTFEGSIEVALRAAGERAELVVRDTGTGIPVEEQSRLFERFARVAGAASRSHEGSGIGLALVHDLVAAHGGTVTVDSTPGEGSAFTVAVPLGNRHLPPEQLIEASAAPVPAQGRARGFLAEALRWLTGQPEAPALPAAAASSDRRATVLVVDDNADMRHHVARLLSDEYEVLLAADGLEGLARARADAPDLVLSDVMMPGLDGLGLLREMREDARTAQTPVVLLSARAGDEATVEGLEAGADDYLAKPFSARELRARVRANLELEKVRRHRRDLGRTQELLDQAQRLAQVGSWEIELATGALSASSELLHQLRASADEVAAVGLAGMMSERVHPDDRERVQAALDAAADGAPLDYELRLRYPDGDVRVFHTRGELERGEDGAPLRLRGSNQDVTDQRAAERALAAAAAAEQVAIREHRIADELQRSLLPSSDVRAEALRVAAYYRAGVAGTQVGGDWYDVVELGAGRTALVLGDVMGRGVRAAAVMGQLRSAVRAYARLDLTPTDVLEHLDEVVRDLGEDQIVTCVYAVYDPYDQVLTWANAGHLPPLVRHPDGRVERLADADGAPLGSGVGPLREQRVQLSAGAVLALYTDGLVESRASDIDQGVDALARALGAVHDVEAGTPEQLVTALLPDGPDDDVAVLVVQVEDDGAPQTALVEVRDHLGDVRRTRHEAARQLRDWGLDEELCDDVRLLLTELVTNALVHGRAPVQVRLRATRDVLVLEVHDTASYLPRRMRPTADDEHGRGLQIVTALSRRWGTRPTPTGKAVWAVLGAPRA